MNSRIFSGKIMHSRAWPVRHRFEYPLYLYGIDLAELPELDKKIPLFGYNRIRPVSIHDKDYLFPEPGSIREKLDRILSASGIGDVSRVVLITAARYFNYVFNPASFFYCFRADGSLACVVIQVNNTFREMHLYVPGEAAGERSGYLGHFSAQKVFHVSPFFDRKGSYEFFLSDVGKDSLDILIHYRQGERIVFAARLTGKARPMDRRSLSATLARHPAAAALTMPRILWQAGRLYFQRKLPVFDKPAPFSPMTIRRPPPGPLQKLGKRAFFSHLSSMEAGLLEVHLPDGSRRTLGETGKGQEGTLLIRDEAFFRRILMKGEMGLGESYTAGDWTSPDLPGLLDLLARNLSSLKERRNAASSIANRMDYFRHRVRANTVRGSARNIRDHYDLGNQFFALFLDPTMTYSCALFETGKESLEEAQKKKLHSIMDLAGIDSGHHVLEIGCGWGSFAIEAARERGCRVTGITLSREQLEFAKKRVEEAGLADRITLELRDYRHIEGVFERVVSIEMLEAVGHANLGQFFAVCEKALKPEGMAVVQVITIADERYEAYRNTTDWIRRHIFPGGHLPSLGAMKSAIARDTELNLEKVLDIGPHYAPTLDCWRQNLLAAKERIMDLGFDENSLRKWEFYFAYCGAGFRKGIIQDHQMVLQRTPD